MRHDRENGISKDDVIEMSIVREFSIKICVMIRVIGKRIFPHGDTGKELYGSTDHQNEIDTKTKE